MPDQLEDAKEVLPKKQTPCQINCEPSGHDHSRCPGAGRHEKLLLFGQLLGESCHANAHDVPDSRPAASARPDTYKARA